MVKKNGPQLNSCFKSNLTVHISNKWVHFRLDCEPNKYGLHCSFDCGHCKNGKPCSTVSGACIDGCEDGWTGLQCDTGKKQQNQFTQ